MAQNMFQYGVVCLIRSMFDRLRTTHLLSFRVSALILWNKQAARVLSEQKNSREPYHNPQFEF